ncbi:MAG: GNAT family N-acetyltransferase [Vulcanimicrobiaceae bacterium]
MLVEPLDTAMHDRTRFRCGVEGVDHYFQAVARQAADRFVAQTYVLVPSPPREEPCKVIGYYTLVSHAYRDAEMDETTARVLNVKSLGYIPTILLGQLGVSTAHQRKGVGPALLRDALRRALYVALSVGAVAVVTDPIDERAHTFCAKYGFQRIVEDKPRLLIPIRQIAKYNLDIVASFKQQPQLVTWNGTYSAWVMTAR